VHDPHDAILGAANYLHASGAPADYRVALYHYNPVPEYVDAVMRYAPSDDPRPQDVLCVLQLAGLRFIPHHPTAQRDGSGVPPSQILYVVS
jgi:hypothetical protein